MVSLWKKSQEVNTMRGKVCCFDLAAYFPLNVDFAVVLKIDDGTGVVECIKYISDSEVASPVDNITIGEFVHVKGVLIVVDR